MEKFETPPDSPPVIIIDLDDQPMWPSTRTVAPTPSSAIVQLPISNNSHIKEMLCTCYGHGLTKGTIIQIFYHGLDDPTQGILDAGGIFLYKTPNEAFKILEEKVSLQIDSEFLTIRKELKEIRDGHRDNHASQIYMSDDMPMCDSMEANYFQGYHGGYHDPNERMKNQVVELECKINQGLRNRQAIIENLERQFKYLKKIQPTKSLPRTTYTKPKHEFVYKPPLILNENDKGDVKFIEEDEIEPIQIDFTVLITYTNAKTFADDVLPNHVGDDELNSTDGVGIGKIKEKKEEDDMCMPKEPNIE
ncbi:hypothetical protein Tco_0828395 [Tanacetum coccineum]